MKFIHKKAADQRRANVNRMAGVAFGQQALRSYTAAQKKQRWRTSRHPPMRRSTVERFSDLAVIAMHYSEILR